MATNNGSSNKAVFLFVVKAKNIFSQTGLKRKTRVKTIASLLPVAVKNCLNSLLILLGLRF